MFYISTQQKRCATCDYCDYDRKPLGNGMVGGSDNLACHCFVRSPLVQDTTYASATCSKYKVWRVVQNG